MKQLLTAIACLAFWGTPGAQTPNQVQRYKAALEQTTFVQPLNSLTPAQMNAVAGLVLAAKAGMPVEDFCPPLKQFAGQLRPCQAEMVAMAKAHDACEAQRRKARQPVRCYDLEVAEANAFECHMRDIGPKLQTVGVVRTWPQPTPKPY